MTDYHNRETDQTQTALSGEAGWALSEAQYDGVRELIRKAYDHGCREVHENFQPLEEPDFTEASYDYAESVTHEFINLFPSVRLSAAIGEQG